MKPLIIYIAKGRDCQSRTCGGMVDTSICQIDGEIREGSSPFGCTKDQSEQAKTGASSLFSFGFMLI